MFTDQAAGTRPIANGTTTPTRLGRQRLLIGAVVAAAATTIVAPPLATPAMAGPPPAPLPVVAKGTVVDTSTGAAVAGARVSYVEVGALKTRFVGCSVHRVLPIIRWTYPVVPTWGAACAHSPRAMGRIGLDRRP